MITSAINNKGKSTRKKKKEDDISFIDVITDKKTKNFIRKKMGVKTGNTKKLLFSDFFELILEEFSCLFDEISSEEEDSLKAELFNLLSINGDNEISLNALEIFTREKGLNQSIEKIYKKIKHEAEENRKQKINESIVREMDELKKILDKKKSDLISKEAFLNQREEILNTKEDHFIGVLEGVYEDFLVKLEDVSKKKTAEIFKK